MWRSTLKTMDKGHSARPFSPSPLQVTVLGNLQLPLDFLKGKSGVRTRAVWVMSPCNRIQASLYSIYILTCFTFQALGKYSIVLTIKADFFPAGALQYVYLSIITPKPNFNLGQFPAFILRTIHNILEIESYNH